MVGLDYETSCICLRSNLIGVAAAFQGWRIYNDVVVLGLQDIQ